jgi:hypothetical protein
MASRGLPKRLGDMDLGELRDHYCEVMGNKPAEWTDAATTAYFTRRTEVAEELRRRGVTDPESTLLRWGKSG